MKRDIYQMRLHISPDFGIIIIPPIDIHLERIVSDWAETLKSVIEDDIKESGYLDDHEEGEFDCLVLWRPNVHHTQDGDEYDVDFRILKEKKVEDEKQK